MVLAQIWALFSVAATGGFGFFMRVFPRRCLAAVIGIVALSSGRLSAQALDGSGSQSPSSPDIRSPVLASSDVCILHVWPSAGARSSYGGWFHGGAVDGDRRGIKHYPVMHAEILSTAAQQQLLTSIDWAKLLAAPGLSVVVHEQAPEAQDDRSRTARLIGDAPTCYDEVIIHSVLVERAALSANTVRVMIIAKKWRGPGSAPLTHTIMATERVDLDGQTNEIVEASIKSGFVTSIEKILGSSYFQQH